MKYIARLGYINEKRKVLHGYLHFKCLTTNHKLDTVSGKLRTHQHIIVISVFLDVDISSIDDHSFYSTVFTNMVIKCRQCVYSDVISSLYSPNQPFI